MAEQDDLLLSLAVEACDEPAGPQAAAAALEEADMFLDLATAAEADEAGSGGPGGSSGSGSKGGPRLSWAAKAAAAGMAGAVPPGHQPRQAVLLQPGVIPRSAPPPLLLPCQQAAPSGRVAVFGAVAQPAVGGSSSGSGSTFNDVGQGTLVERHAGLKIKNPRVSHTQLCGRLADTAVLRLSHVRSRHRTAGLQGSWATICVIGEKSKPRETANGHTYSIWKVTDLDQTCLSLFLFSGAHDDLWKEPEGSILALFTPKVRAEGDFSLSVDSTDQIWVVGHSPEFGYCKAKKKNGEPCRMPVNASRCPFCPFHVQSEYNRMKPVGRNEFQTTNLKTAFRPGMQRGLQWAPGEFESTTAKQQRLKQVGAAQLGSVASSARERGSAAGARYLNTVANPAAAAAAEAASQRKLTPAAAIAEAAQRGPMAMALAAAPIPAGRSGGALVLQLPRQPKQQLQAQQGKRKAGAALGQQQAQQAGEVNKRRSSNGGGGSGGDSGSGGGIMIELDDDEDGELATAGMQAGGTAGGYDPTADARARALALLRAAGGAPADPNNTSSRVPAALQADVQRMQQKKDAAANEQMEAWDQQQQQQQEGPAPPAVPAGRAALAQVEANRRPPPLPSVVSGGAGAPRLPPAAKRTAAAAAGSRGGRLGAAGGAAAAAARPTQAAAKPSAPKSAMEAAFGGVIQEFEASGAAAKGTRYKELVDDEEFERLDKVMSALEQKDEAAAKMDAITRLTVQAFRCKVCSYTAERRRPECAAHAYAVERVEATKRWWQCDGCKYRFTTVGQKYPGQRCIKCNQPGTGFTTVSMLRPKKEHDFEKQQSSLASRDKLLARGVEQKWCNA